MLFERNAVANSALRNRGTLPVISVNSMKVLELRIHIAEGKHLKLEQHGTEQVVMQSW